MNAKVATLRTQDEIVAKIQGDDSFFGFMSEVLLPFPPSSR